MILVDAGPLIALANADDQYHRSCAAALKTIRQPLATVWPVLTEAVYLASRAPGAQEAILEMIARGAVQLQELGVADVPRIRELMRKYADRGIDLADAALVRVAEREHIRDFFTVDRKDFAVYRLHGKIRPSLIPL